MSWSCGLRKLRWMRCGALCNRSSINAGCGKTSDHQTGKVLAYVLATHEDAALKQLHTLLAPFSIERFYTDSCGAEAAIVGCTAAYRGQSKYSTAWAQAFDTQNSNQAIGAKNRLFFAHQKKCMTPWLDCSSTAMNSDGQFSISSTRLEHDPSVLLTRASLKVCHNRRIAGHRVFKGLAARGKTSEDWFLDSSYIWLLMSKANCDSVMLTPGNTENRKPVPQLLEEVFGKVWRRPRLYFSKPCISVAASLKCADGHEGATWRIAWCSYQTNCCCVDVA